MQQDMQDFILSLEPGRCDSMFNSKCIRDVLEQQYPKTEWEVFWLRDDHLADGHIVSSVFEVYKEHWTRACFTIERGYGSTHGHNLLIFADPKPGSRVCE
mmetsp:Transcript_94291/g.130981  ORF Transcript_94291/g.130981 Transcript_94291/m.130981 type:complete len:100 (-) Transcript_94291:42-341(-)